ncbi:MAG: DNA repair protein RecO [Oscillatoria sp. SIO1A7]|nr:DNA repair protein RecO [Oscillatoria sp. SIO1A7]
MSRTYKATGINLKNMPLGESDRLVTILTREEGLIRATAPGARKPRSKLSGRSQLFVVNELLLYRGRSLAKITQAQTIKSYPGLSRDLGKLAAGQYIAELVLCQALSEQPQEELFDLTCEHLSRIERSPAVPQASSRVPVMPLLTQGIYHLLAFAGVAPQVHNCCLTGLTLTPDFKNPNWKVGFSFSAGGAVSLSRSLSSGDRPGQARSLTNANQSNGSQSNGNQGNAFRIDPSRSNRPKPRLNSGQLNSGQLNSRQLDARQLNSGQLNSGQLDSRQLNARLSAAELAILQQLSYAELPPLERLFSDPSARMPSSRALDRIWISLERLLRGYTEYQFERQIRSATPLDSYTQETIT